MHVVMRGNDRRDIFLREGDRHFFRACLDDAFRLQGVALHAYVFMTNHVHMLVTPARRDSIGRALQSVGPRYVGYFNRHHERTGSLWEGRHKTFLVKTDHYLFACMRYIELNPVRAGMVRDPVEYAWSSHRFHAGGREDSLLTPHRNYMALSADANRRCGSYLGMFDEVKDRRFTHEFRRSGRSGEPAGDEAFREWVKGIATLGSDPRV